MFPVDTLNTVTPRKVLFGDFNGDGQLDMFVASHGWDTQPYPGEQNRLFLSRPGGGWRDATAELPQLSDYSHTAAIGDIRGRGSLDVVIGNYLAPPPNRVLSYALLNNGSGQFTLSREVIPVAAGETMDAESGHCLLGLTLADLTGDGLPELVVMGDATDGTKKLRRTTV
ncbi:MAG: VCBS repeat-containing protein [Rubrivivax sp.]